MSDFTFFLNYRSREKKAKNKSRRWGTNKAPKLCRHRIPSARSSPHHRCTLLLALPDSVSGPNVLLILHCLKKKLSIADHFRLSYRSDTSTHAHAQIHTQPHIRRSSPLSPAVRHQHPLGLNTPDAQYPSSCQHFPTIPTTPLPALPPLRSPRMRFTPVSLPPHLRSLSPPHQILSGNTPMHSRYVCEWG